MATFKLNIAKIRGLSDTQTLKAAMEEYGLPEDDEFGVLNASATEHAVFATIVRKTQTAVPTLDAEHREVTSSAVEKVALYPFAINPGRETLEVYAGAAKGFEEVGVFLASALALPAVVDPIELDVVSAVDKLSRTAEKFQLRSIRVSEYAHDSYMSGPYSPKFLESQHGMDFLAEYAEYVTAAKVRFQAPTGRANAGITPKACFSYSCNEDDQSIVQSILRKLV